MNDLSATQRCVKCGLCLPHCPTFLLTGNEADSPRGRISLMQLLDRPHREWSPGVFKHLDQCLLCHACEAMCPSQVPFGQLMDTARERLEPHRHRPVLQRWIQSAALGLLTSKTGQRLATVLLRISSLLGLQSLARLQVIPAGLKRLLLLLPASRRSGPEVRRRQAELAKERIGSMSAPEYKVSLREGALGHKVSSREGALGHKVSLREGALGHKVSLREDALESEREQLGQRSAVAPDLAKNNAAPTLRGKVKLFTGCTGELFDRETLQATRRLLQRLGYQVSVPSRQDCCGALHAHNGKPAKARQLAAANLDAFAGDREPIVTFATGCAAQLLGYRTHDRRAEEFSQRVKDIVDFLAEDAKDALRFKPLPESVALYIPCTQRNVLKQQATLLKTLAQVPQLRIVTVNPEGGCCGAAGSYMLTQAALSERLRDIMVERVVNSGAPILLTTNIGCSLQLGAGLKRREADIAVMHPVVLFESLLID